MKDKSRFIFFGAAVAILVLLNLKDCLDQSTSTKLYYIIALVSFELSFLEMLRSLIKITNRITFYRNYSSSIYKKYIIKKMNVFKKVSFLKSEINDCKQLLKDEEERINISKNYRMMRWFNIIETIIEVIQILATTIIMIVVPFMPLPEETKINGMINTFTLGAFACTFFSYFNSRYDNIYENIDVDKVELMVDTSSEYLDIIDKIADKKT